jgi:hypothetical protein
MTPTTPTADRMQPPTHTQPAADDVCPRFFLDDAIDAGTDGDWWLDLGRVDLPFATAV